MLSPSTVDIALLVDAYHEFEYPREMMLGIVAALKPGGRVILLEYRGENPMIMIKGLHKMTEKQVKKEMNSVSRSAIWNSETRTGPDRADRDSTVTEETRRPSTGSHWMPSSEQEWQPLCHTGWVAGHR